MADDNSNRPPFRADHVGSLLRPAALLDARENWKRGKLSRAELTRIEDDAVRAAVKLQEDIGLNAITDGDYRRDHWWVDFVSGIGGVKIAGGMPVKFHNEGGDIEYAPPRAEVAAKLSRPAGGISLNDFKFLKSATRRTAKECVPSPTVVHFRGGREAVSRDAYPDMDAFFADLARVYNEEFKAMAAAGCTYLQIDDTNFAFLCDPGLRENTRRMGEDPNALTHRYARLVNESIRGLRPQMSISVHLCRGNHESSWVAAGGYEPVADALLNELDVDGFFLEYDTPRAGDFHPLRFLPHGKKVVLGLVTTKKAEIENADDVRRRIDEAAKVVPLERLCLSPQCGFASTKLGNRLTLDDEKRKLALVVSVAEKVWGSA
jgi:5-methyltetrahydropteroyltriglutamate--homocysteine methyltransferase